MDNKILYIGSGKSATQALDPRYDGCIKVAVNNCWRLFDGSRFDVWIHSGDFPKERCPKHKNYDREISYEEYSKSVENASKLFGWVTDSPQHYAGYTIFLWDFITF